jgi:predicted Zn-dependent peptidase
VSPSVASRDAEFQRTVLPNGLTVLSERMPGVRSVALGAWIRAASIHEPPERMGVSHLLEHMVFKGTETRSAKQIALELEALGGALDAFTSREHTVYQARVLEEHVVIACDVLADLVFRPLLRTADLKLERKVILEEIGMVEDTPDDLVFDLHNEALWGGHPYGYSILGTRDTVARLGISELRELHERAYHPAQMVVTATGSIDHDRLLQSLERTGWMKESSRDASPLVVTLPTTAPPARRHVAREGAQTHLVVGSGAVPHGDPRRHPLVLLSVLLGAGMSSRLFQRVREELGLAYSVYTYQSFHADTGTHGVYVGTAPEQALDAWRAIREELATVVTSGVPDDEIEMAKNQLKGQLIISLESVTARMYRLAGLELYDEPYRTLDEMLALIDSIQPADVSRVAGEFFDPDRQTILSLGPAAVEFEAVA